MQSAGEALNSLLGKDREPTLREQIEEATSSGETCFSLSYEERIIGFVGCVGAGLFLNMFSVVRLTELMLGNPIPFAVCFTIGNILSMGSMCFLVGPVRQCRNLFSPNRASATAVYLLMMGCTLFTAFYPEAGNILRRLVCRTVTDKGLTHLERVVLIMVCLVLQCLALAWYALSYIPFGQRLVRSYAWRLCCMGD